MVTLDKPFKINLPYVNPICLPYHSRIQWDLPTWQDEEYTVTGMTKAIVLSICVTDFIFGIRYFSGYGQFDIAHPPRSNYLRYTRMRAIPKLDCFNRTIPNAEKYLPYIDESKLGEGLYLFLIMLILFCIYVSKFL